MMDDTDLTDPHGEAEALRRENERLRRNDAILHDTIEKLLSEGAQQLARAEAAEAALAAAPVAEAQPVAWEQTGVMDRHGRMICVGDRIRVDLTGPHTKREYWRPEYIVEWKPPAFKLRYVGGDKDSDTAQWRFSTAQPDALEIISQRPPAQPDWKAMAERLGDAGGKLDKAASEVIARGAQTGPQWSRLTAASLHFRAALSDLAKMKGETK